MKHFALLAVLAGCNTAPKPEVTYCMRGPTLGSDLQVCQVSPTITCVMYEGSVSCVRTLFTSKT